jgi:hypothetical protein
MAFLTVANAESMKPRASRRAYRGTSALTSSGLRRPLLASE